MSENFAQLFEESLENLNFDIGKVIKGEVIEITRDFVLVDAGLKSESLIPINQFKNDEGELTVVVGDQVDVALDAIEDSYGETRLSRERARRLEAWQHLQDACEAKETVQGVITGKVKGGFTVELNTVRAFLPGSLVDTRPLKDTTFLENKTLDFKVIKIDQKRNNVVVSRRAVIEEENSTEREALLESLTEGQIIKGMVKNLTDYGAFIDLGGIDGLLHITDMSWKRIKHPSEMIAVGDEIEVKILQYDRERRRVSLGIKQMGDDPWNNVIHRFQEGKKAKGTVSNIADYGCFVELEDGIEGLVHVSEMDWTNKNSNPSKIVQLGQEVEVVVLDVDEERRRISLGLKQCIENPWEVFANKHGKGSKVEGVIKSITDFGVFLGLDGGIDGLIHLSDLSWTESGDTAVRKYKKGDSVEAIVLAVDIERERISLGLKQLENDALSDFMAEHKKGDDITGKVETLESNGAIIDLGGEVKGFIKTTDLSLDKISKPEEVISIGDEVTAQYTGIDRKNQLITLSIKALELNQEKTARAKYMRKDGDKTATSSLGDILKEQLDNNKKSDK